MVQALCTRLRSAEGQIRFGVTVSSIKADAGGVRLISSSGDHAAERAIVTSRSFAPVSIGGVFQKFDTEGGVCRNVVLHIRGGGGTPFSYVEILGDKHLKRVRDLSALVRPPTSVPERILCVQHRSEMTTDAFADAQVLADNLLRVGLLQTTPEVVNAVRTDVELTTLTDVSLARVQRQSGGRIEVLTTTDFAEGFIDGRTRIVTHRMV